MSLLLTLYSSHLSPLYCLLKILKVLIGTEMFLGIPGPRIINGTRMSSSYLIVDK